MKTKQQLTMDLTRYSGPQTIYAAQDDKFSRDVEIILLSDGLPWMIPEDVSVQIRYRKSDGTGGEYGELSEGTPAWSVTDNLLTIILAPEVLDVSGSGSLSVVMTQGQAQLSTFFMGLSVDAAVDSDEPASDGSGKKRKYLPAPDSAEAGQYLRVLSVDEDGYVTEVEAVPAENTVGIHNEDSEAHPDLRLQLNDCVRTSEQELTEEAKAWARENIGAVSASDVETIMKDYEPAETMEIIPSGNTGVWINNYGSYKTEVANFYLHEPIRLNKNMQTLQMKNVVVNTTVAKLVYSHTPTIVDGVSYKKVMLPGDNFATVDYDEQIDTSYEYLFIAQNTNSNGNIQSGAQYFITGTAEDIKEVAVRHTAQTLTDDQKAQARSNIGAVSEEDVVYIMGNREVLETVEVFPTGSTGVWINSNGAYKTEVANEDPDTDSVEPQVTYVAKIGEQGYETLAAAVEAAANGDKIVLQGNFAGAGVVIDKSITIDFGGFTYTFTEGVGSTGTPSNGFQILKDNTVTFHRGICC